MKTIIVSIAASIFASFFLRYSIKDELEDDTNFITNYQIRQELPPPVIKNKNDTILNKPEKYNLSSISDDDIAASKYIKQKLQ